MGGSFAGIAITAAQAPNLQFTVLFAVILGLFAVLCLVGIYCGVLLLERDSRSFRLAIPFWLLQVPLVTHPVVTFSFYTGARFDFTVSGSGVFGISPGVGSQLVFYLRDTAPAAIGINILALVVVRQLWKHRHTAL